MRRVLYVAVFPLAISILPAPAHAWGEVGHTAICQIAFEELTDTAREQVERLLKLDERYDTFAASCNWPDRPRKRAIEHFVNVPRSAGGLVTGDPCPLASKCVVTAIDVDAGVLSDANATDEQRLDALKFLGHWVGDIHQPMHVGFRDDRGGNRIGERGTSCSSLHSVWDTCILTKGMSDDAMQNAARLGDEIAASQPAGWTDSDPLDWANESFAIAITASVGYCLARPDACWYSSHNKQLDSGEPERTVVVDEDYIATHLATVQMRLKQAGVRLAALLNDLLG